MFILYKEGKWSNVHLSAGGPGLGCQRKTVKVMGVAYRNVKKTKRKIIRNGVPDIEGVANESYIRSWDSSTTLWDDINSLGNLGNLIKPNPITRDF
jgi:hypothetical protein